MATSKTLSLRKTLFVVVLLMSGSLVEARRHGKAPSRSSSHSDSPAFREHKNEWTDGTDLLDWSRDPRRVDPKVYSFERDAPPPIKTKSNSCASLMAHNHYAFSMSGQLEGQEGPSGLLKKDAEQVEPKSKRQLVTCAGSSPKIEHDIYSPHLLKYLSENGVLLERDFPVDRCPGGKELTPEQRIDCPKVSAGNCTTYTLDGPMNAERINGPISGSLSKRIEALLRDYGPMAMYVDRHYELDKEGFIVTGERVCNKVGRYPRDNFLLVGYGRTNADNVGYFKFKTARGASWGDKGYGYIKYTTSQEGPCGHTYGLIDLWKIKPCKRVARRRGHSSA